MSMVTAPQQPADAKLAHELTSSSTISYKSQALKRDAIAQLRVRMQKEFPELRPNDIRDITTMPVSNEKVRDVAHAYEVCFGANSMCMVWSVAVSIAVPDVW